MKKKIFSLELLLIPTIGLTMFLIACFIGSFRFFTDSFFKSFSDLFMDYFDSIRYAAKFDAYSSFNVLYSPLVNLYFMFCSFFIPRSALDPNVDRFVMQHQPMAYVLLAIYFIICFVLLFYSLKRILKKQSKAQIIFIYCLLIFSYPFLYTMERGNTLLLAFVLVVFFCAFFDSDKKYQHELALIALALSATIKLYPVILALYLIKRKAWKDVTKFGIYTTLLLFLPFIFYGGLEGMITMISSSLNFFGEMLHCFSNIYLLLYYGFGVNIVIAKAINYTVIGLFVINFFIVKKRYQEFGALILIFLCTPPGTESYIDIFFLVVLLLLIIEKEHGYLELVYLANLLLFLTFNTSTWLMTFATIYYVAVFYVLHLIVMPIPIIKERVERLKANQKPKQKTKEGFLGVKVKKEWITKLFIYSTLILAACWVIELLLTTFCISPHTLLNNSVFHQCRSDSFADFYNINYFFYNRSPYIEYDSSYPPFNYVLAALFTWIQKLNFVAGIVVYIVCFIACLALIAFLVIRKYKFNWKESLMIGASLIVSAPLLFLFERGNYLIFTFTFVCLFLLTYNSEKRVVRELSYVWLAIAIATKLYPVVFALILLKEKRFIDLAKAALYTVAMIVLPFFIFEGGFINNISAMLTNLRTFSSYDRLSVDVSTNNMFRIFAYMFGQDYNGFGLIVFAQIVKYALFALMIVAIIFAKKKWHVLALAALSSVVVPSPAMIHSLVFILIAVFAFLMEEDKDRFDYLYMGLFIVMITPLQFGYIISPVPLGEQTKDIIETVPNYLGLSINVFLESLSAFLMAAILSSKIIFKTIQDYRNRSKSV